MSDEMQRCKVCGVWEQQSNPAEGCCDRCGNNARKLHGYIHQVEAEAIRYQDLKTALTTMHETADILKAERDELREACKRFRQAIQSVEAELEAARDQLKAAKRGE